MEDSTGTLGATHAQGFTTGSNATGYDLTSIEFNIKTIAATDWPNIRAELWSDDNGEPDARIASLTAPSTPQTGNVAFSAPLGTKLETNTTYHFVIYAVPGTTTTTITNTNSNSEDTGAATGWSIANGSHWVAGSNPTSTTTWTAFSGKRRLRVNGSNASSNANLGGLTASRATSSAGPFSTLGLTPAFSASTTGYTATVANSITHTKLTPTVEDTGRATVTVDGTEVSSGSESGAIALSEGSNAITVQVTAQDGTTKDYSVTVTRQPPLSSNANLSGLTASRATSSAGPFSTLGLTPAFSASTTGYTATVANSITHAKLTPTVEDTGRATVTVDGTEVSSGSESGAIALSEGSNAITVRVTAQNGTTKDYTVTVTRQAATVSNVPTGLTVTPGDAELTARWTAPAGVDVSRYEAQIKLKSASNWPTLDTDVGGTSHTFRSLVNGSPYQVRVRTIEVGEQTPGDWTAPVEGTPAATPTVSLLAAPNPVTEGSPVTVTARLSAALASTVTIPLALTDNSAEPDDHGTLASITVSSGATSGMGTIPTHQDADTEDETFTVALGSLPSSVAAGAPSSVQVRIADDDPPDGTAEDSEEVPPSVTLWTDRPDYRPDDKIRLYLDIDPHGDERECTVFVYRENIGTGYREYLAARSGSRELRSEAVDWYGVGRSHWRGERLGRVEKRLVWAGQAPDPGLWHFVAELRSPGTTQVLKRAYAKLVVPGNGTALLNRPGTERALKTDLRLASDRVYYLGDRLRVKSGATLAIEAGTLIKAWGPAAAIVVEPGGRIEVRGRREAPVVMTCSAPVGQRFPGCWGGLSVRGRAAADPHESSGALRYLRVEFAGGSSAPAAPAAALAFEDVGAGTAIEHVQVHASLGDGLAFRSGTAHCRYCVVSDTLGDSVVWSGGWQGGAQHLYVQQGERAASALRGQHSGPATLPGPAFRNVTLIGGYNIGVPGGTPGTLRSIGPGIVLEAQAAIAAWNVLATGFGGFAVDAPAASFADGRSRIAGAVLRDSGVRHPGPSQVPGALVPWVRYTHAGPDPLDSRPAPAPGLNLINVRHEPNPDPRPRSGSAGRQLGWAVAAPFDRRFSRAADYVGAFGRHNWLEEWTVFGAERAYEPPARDLSGQAGAGQPPQAAAAPAGWDAGALFGGVQP